MPSNEIKATEGHFTAAEAAGMVDYHMLCGKESLKQSEVWLLSSQRHIETARKFQAMHKELVGNDDL